MNGFSVYQNLLKYGKGIIRSWTKKESHMSIHLKSVFFKQILCCLISSANRHYSLCESVWFRCSNFNVIHNSRNAKGLYIKYDYKIIFLISKQVFQYLYIQQSNILYKVNVDAAML